MHDDQDWWLEDLQPRAQIPRIGFVPDLLAQGRGSKDQADLTLGRMRAAFSSTLAIAGVFLIACAPRDQPEPGDSTTPAAATPGQVATPDSAASCFVANRSVLARAANTPAPGPENLRGWILLDQFGTADSAGARLTDSDGYSLEAFWRTVGDSIVVQGFNDFVRIEMRLRLADSAVRGSIVASSDAALERDAAGKLVEFRRSGTIRFVKADCQSMPKPAGGAAIDVLPHGTPKPGIRFDPSTIKRGTRVGALTLDSIEVQRTVVDSTHVGRAHFRGEIQLRGWTLRHPDPDLSRILTCFEADSSSSARLPRWTGDERRAWFCFSNRPVAAAALGPPSEGVPATIVVDQFTIHRGMSDEVNSARFLRLVRRGAGDG